MELYVNLQVFQTHTETNPFATDDNDELLERLKNKERDPMSMSFYQEKDDDTCERLINKNESHVDLNAVQPLPDSDDDDIQQNGVCDRIENDKENISPEQNVDLLGGENDIQEPNNDIMRFDERKDILANNPLSFGQGDNFVDYNVESSSSNNMQTYSNNEFESSNVSQDTVVHTDTPESHKLLFEQIPEIPDGKSSELGFTPEDLLDQTESEKDTRILTPQEEMSQDVDMESKIDDSPCIGVESEIPELPGDASEKIELESQSLEDKENEIIPESELNDNIHNAFSTERLPASPLPVEDRLAEVISPEIPHDIQDNIKVDIHQSADQNFDEDFDADMPHERERNNVANDISQIQAVHETPDIKIDSEDFVTDAEIDRACSQPLESSVLAESPLPSHSPLPSQSPAHIESANSPLPVESPVSAKSPQPSVSPIPSKSPLPTESPAPQESLLLSESPTPTKSPHLAESPAPPRSLTPAESTAVLESPLPLESPIPSQSPAPEISTDLLESSQTRSPQPDPENIPESATPDQLLVDQPPAQSPLPADVPLPRESPLPVESPLPTESPLPAQSPVAIECSLPVESSIPREAPPATEEPAVIESLPVEAVFVSSSPAFAQDAPSPVIAESFADTAAIKERLSPEVAQEAVESTTPVFGATAGPTPDIVPEEPVPRSDLVTDIDIGVPESRAQEICVPVTSEIQLDDAVQAGTGTPPPTPAVDAAPVAAPLSDTPIAADVAPALAAGALAAAAAAATAAATVAVAKPKTPATKKSPTTPTAAKATPKAATRTSAVPSPRTPASAAKKPAAPSPARPPAGAKPAAPATKAAPAARTFAAKPAAANPRAAPKGASASAKEPAAAPRAAPPASRIASARAPAAPKAPAARPATAPAAKPAPRPAAARPAAARPAPAAAPAPAPAARPPPISRPKDIKPKAPVEKKPLANGDVKEGKPAPRAAAPRPAPAARPAPRPAPRAPAAAAPAPAK